MLPLTHIVPPFRRTPVQCVQLCKSVHAYPSSMTVQNVGGGSGIFTTFYILWLFTNELMISFF